MNPIYLDHAATTPLAPEVALEMKLMLEQSWANPASLHASGRRASTRLEDAKDRIKSLLLGPHAQNYGQWQGWQIVVTSGGTEANNLALNGLRGHDGPLIISATEHPSVLAAAQSLPGLSPHVHILPVQRLTGLPNIDALEEKLRLLLTDLGQSKPSIKPLVSIMVGNNETGVLSNIALISQLCRQYGAVLHTDAVQAFGKIDLTELVPGVDALTISGHKLHGPVGVGALLVRTSAHLRPLIVGGGQQLGLRPGTESVLLTCALATACELSEKNRLSGAIEQMGALRSLFEERLCQVVPSARIIGLDARRLPHISCVAFPGWDRQALLMALDMAGIACSSGSACASGSSQPSHVLSAMQLDDDWIAGAIRFSFSYTTSAAEIADAVDRIANIFSKTK